MLKEYSNLLQGTDEWFDARRGVLTASEMKHIITPTLKVADNDKSRAHLYELLGQQITGYTEPTYLSNDMIRGQEDEIYAREAYAENYTPVRECGFITNDKWGFTLGYSPDGLIGQDGQIESKSRRQKFQIETILSNEMPSEYSIQIQTGLLVSEREWCDFISYCGGLPMFVKRIFADPATQTAILLAAESFYEKLHEKLSQYTAITTDKGFKFIPTKRIIHEEMYV